MQLFLFSLLSFISAAVVPQALTDGFRAVGKDIAEQVHSRNVIEVIDGAVSKLGVQEGIPSGKVLIKNMNTEKEKLIDVSALHNFNPSKLSRKEARFLGYKPVPATKGPVFLEANPKPGMKTWKKGAIAGGVLGTAAVGTTVVLNHNKHQ